MRFNKENLLRGVVVLGILIGIVMSNNVTVAIIGTNDIHGAAFPARLIRSDNVSQQYLYGGLEYMGRLIQIVQK